MKRVLRAFSSSFPDIQAAWDRPEPLKPSRTAPRGARRGLGSYRLYGPNHAPESGAPQGAVRFGFGATQQTQALWICAEHEERGESFRFHRFLGTTSAFYLGRSRVYLRPGKYLTFRDKSRCKFGSGSLLSFRERFIHVPEICAAPGIVLSR